MTAPGVPTIPPPLAAVRTVNETDDVHTIEGLAFPFRGLDTYRTFFSARTDFSWDLFPDVEPGAGEPLFVRPVTFHHGFDPEMGLARIGGWSPVRSDADGVWVRAQLDKRAAYYATRIKPLLDAGALGLSGGSAEHSVRIDERTGEIQSWPAYELALTPTESNPLAQLAMRAGDMAALVTIIAAGEGSEGAETPEGMASILDAAIALHDAHMASSTPPTPESQGELGGLLRAARLMCDAEPMVRAVRAGARNSAADLAAIQQMHDLSAEFGATCAEPGMEPDAARSTATDDQPATVTIAVRQDVPTLDELTRRFAARAAETGTAVARQMTG